MVRIGVGVEKCVGCGVKQKTLLLISDIYVEIRDGIKIREYDNCAFSTGWRV